VALRSIYHRNMLPEADWSITQSDFHDMTYDRIDYWMVLNGVEWTTFCLTACLPLRCMMDLQWLASVRAKSQDHSSVQPAIDAQRQDWQAAVDCRVLRGGILVGWFTHHFNADFPW
jgi:hypothetical protein